MTTRRARRITLLALVAGALVGCGTTQPQVTTVGGGGSGDAVGSVAAPDSQQLGGGTTDPGAGVGASGGGLPRASTGSAPGAATGVPATPSGSVPVPSPGPVANGQHPVPGSSPRTGVVAHGSASPRAGAGASRGPIGAVARPSGAASGGPGTPPAAGARPAGITVGVSDFTVAQGNAALGVQTNNSSSEMSDMRAVVAGLNASGGIAGEKITPIYYDFNTNDTDYQTDADAACQKFTQDNHVSLVIDTAFGASHGYETCLGKAGVPVISVATNTSAALAAGLTNQASSFGMTFDRNYTTALPPLTASGYLSKKSVLGVLMDDCPETIQAYKNTIAPLIAKLGLTVKDTAKITCPAGTSNEGQDASQLQEAVLTFKTDQVDRVMAVSGAEDGGLYLFATAANAQSYFPGYVLSSIGEAAVERPNIPQGQWAGLHGAGYIPGLDVDAVPSSFTANEQRCLAIVKAGGIVPASTVDYYYSFSDCGLWLLAEAALTADGGVTAVSTFLAAIRGLGTSFSSPGIVDGATDFSRRSDGPAHARTFSYDAGCTCMKYDTPATTVP